MSSEILGALILLYLLVIPLLIYIELAAIRRKIESWGMRLHK